MYQLSKEKSDFTVVAAEEDNSTAGSSGENEGLGRSSTPQKAAKQPSSKSPAKAKKPEGLGRGLVGRRRFRSYLQKGVLLGWALKSALQSFAECFVDHLAVRV